MVTAQSGCIPSEFSDQDNDTCLSGLYHGSYHAPSVNGTSDAAVHIKQKELYCMQYQR
jgi:hypothetical protein